MSAPLVACRCASCGHVVWPARSLCSVCGAAAWEDVVAEAGVVEERTETTSPAAEPVAIASVRLDAGPVVIARVDDAAIGEAVRVTHDDGVLRALTRSTTH